MQKIGSAGQREGVDVGEVAVIGLAVDGEYWYIGATMTRLATSGGAA